jgi:hypothetical protein
MQAATLTPSSARPEPPPAGRHLRDPAVLARLAFAALCVAAAVGFLVFPTYPNYDSYYSLLWAREVLDLDAPTFEGFRVPTEHPLAIAIGLVLAPLGEAADRVWIAGALASFLVLVWGVYRLGRIAFTPLVGAIAAALLLTRFDFAFLAARGYIDVPYMALVIWAAVLEADRPRRGAPVFLLLALAGLLRPEAWLLAGLYFLWMAWKAPWGARVWFAALTALAPVLWCLTDLAVTGDPLFSLHYTSSSAEELGRQRTLAELPFAVPGFFSSLVKPPVLAAAVLGVALAAVISPTRMVMPFLLLASGVATFALIGIAGLSVIERYLIVAALALLVFAAVAAGGFTMLRPSRARRLWMVGAVLLVAYGAVFTLSRTNLTRFQNELRFRGDAHAALVDVLNDPEVRAGLRCGPLTLPNHKLVPDSRWILDLPFAKVQPRADPDVGALPTRGVAVYVTSRFALFKHAFSDPGDPPEIQVIPAGFQRVAISPYYAAYVRCP